MSKELIEALSACRNVIHDYVDHKEVEMLVFAEALAKADAVLSTVKTNDDMTVDPQRPDRLVATFRPQADGFDGSIHDLGESTRVEFDATAALLSLSNEDIRNFQYYNTDSDNLADGLHAKEDHYGPFEVDVDLDDWLEDNSIECAYTELTDEQIDMLRKKFL